MVTRAYFIIRCNGIYYTFFNNYDSFPSGMGKSLQEQIKEVIHNHKGNIQEALLHWRSVFGNVLTRSKVSEDAICNYRDLEQQCENNPATLIPETVDTKHPRLHFGNFSIEYMYIINLDDGLLLFTTFCLGLLPPTAGGWLKITWKEVQRLDIDVLVMHMVAWIRVIGTAIDSTGKELCGLIKINDENREHHERFTSYPKHILAYLVQPLVRGFLERRRQCAPPDGYLYLRSKRMFELQQQAPHQAQKRGAEENMPDDVGHTHKSQRLDGVDQVVREEIRQGPQQQPEQEQEQASAQTAGCVVAWPRN